MKTEIVFVLDRSGSMNGLQNDVIGGFNSYIQQQKENKEETFLTTVLFDHQYEMIHDHINIQDVKTLTSKEYFPRGMTALLDAIGNTIAFMDEKVSKEDKVIFMINTDGFENASKEYTYPLVQKMIKKHEHWEFVFLGARIDAINEASKLGISEERAVRYFESSDGVEETYASLSTMTNNIRANKLNPKDKSWKEKIERNYKKNTRKS